MFITINKPLHLWRLADTPCFHQRTPGDVFPEACPRLPPGSPHGWLKLVCLRGNFNTSVKCVKWFFTQLSSSSYRQEWGQEACRGFLPPLPGTVIQSFDISEQKNSGTCWGFTLLLLQTATIMEIPLWTTVWTFLEKCGLMGMRQNVTFFSSLLFITWHPILSLNKSSRTLEKLSRCGNLCFRMVQICSSQAFNVD